MLGTENAIFMTYLFQYWLQSHEASSTDHDQYPSHIWKLLSQHIYKYKTILHLKIALTFFNQLILATIINYRYCSKTHLRRESWLTMPMIKTFPMHLSYYACDT